MVPPVLTAQASAALAAASACWASMPDVPRSSICGRVRDSVVWDDCMVEGDIERCIVAHGVRVTGPHRDEVLV